MASPEVLDFSRLLVPIPGDNPAGASLRDDFSPTSVYRVIKDARAAARAAERSVLWGGDGGPSPASQAPWKPVLELAPKVIAEQSKDLEVTAWLIEALLRQYGYAGLRDGFRLARELAVRFWDNLYPLPDEDGMAVRVAAVTGLNGEESDGVLIAPITNVPITAAGSLRPLSVADYKQAADLERLGDPDKRAQRIDQGAVTLQMFEKVVLETPPEFLRNVQQDVAQCAEEFERLCAALEEKCGKGADGYSLAPPSSSIRGALETVRETLQNVTRNLPETAGEAQAGQSQPEGGGIAAEGRPGGAVGRVKSREEAFRALLQVAEFFKRTEPHSPVAYALEQAVRWGRMPLPELLTELISEEAVRGQLFKLVGIKPPESKP
jgi:type VI secretion system protein ImpA